MFRTLHPPPPGGLRSREAHGGSVTGAPPTGQKPQGDVEALDAGRSPLRLGETAR